MFHASRIAIFATAAAISLGWAGSAAADCAAEIDRVTKALEASDAGSGPTAGASDTSAGESAGTPAPGTAPGTEATAAMNQVTEGKATSPSDVQRQTEGSPTAGEAASDGSATTTGGAEAQEHLAAARQAQQAGDEAACMKAVGEAERTMG